MYDLGEAISVKSDSSRETWKRFQITDGDICGSYEWRSTARAITSGGAHLCASETYGVRETVHANAIMLLNSCNFSALGIPLEVSPTVQEAEGIEINNIWIAASGLGTTTISRKSPRSALAEASVSRLKAYWQICQTISDFSSHYPTVADQTINVAKSLVGATPSSFPLPQVRPSADGEVGLFWLRGSNRVEAVLDPEDERFVWIGKFDGEFVKGGDEQWSLVLPDRLLEMLSRLYR